MKKSVVHHRSNYANADLNFDIFHLANKRIDDPKLYSVLCVAMNILERGTPTVPSEDLIKNLKLSGQNRAQTLSFFSRANPEFGTRIKGNEKGDQYPARYFYEKILPAAFPEYPFIQQLVCPETLMSDIVPNGYKKYARQQVDFYFPQAKLVIEIDGSQHSSGYQKTQDQARDQYLHKNGIDVIRIRSNDLYNDGVIIQITKDLNRRVNQYSEIMNKLKKDYVFVLEGHAHEELLRTAVMRLQITILQLCMTGELDLRAEEWELRITTDEIQQRYERAAIEDLFTWLKLLCGLADISFFPPRIRIWSKEHRNSFSRIDGRKLEIHISVTGKETDLNHTNSQIVYVFNSWRQDLNYYKYQLADKISYSFKEMENPILRILDLQMSKKDIYKKLKNKDFESLEKS